MQLGGGHCHSPSLPPLHLHDHSRHHHNIWHSTNQQLHIAYMRCASWMFRPGLHCSLSLPLPPLLSSTNVITEGIAITKTIPTPTPTPYLWHLSIECFDLVLHLVNDLLFSTPGWSSEKEAHTAGKRLLVVFCLWSNSSYPILLIKENHLRTDDEYTGGKMRGMCKKLLWVY